MKLLVAFLVLFSSFALAQIPVVDTSNSLAIAETDIPLDAGVVGRMRDDNGCEFGVSTSKEPDTSFLGKVFDRHHYYLQVDTATCTDDSGKRITIKTKARRKLLERPIASGEVVRIPFGMTDYLEYLSEYAEDIKSEEGK